MIHSWENAPITTISPNADSSALIDGHSFLPVFTYIIMHAPYKTLKVWSELLKESTIPSPSGMFSGTTHKETDRAVNRERLLPEYKGIQLSFTITSYTPLVR